MWRVIGDCMDVVGVWETLVCSGVLNVELCVRTPNKDNSTKNIFLCGPTANYVTMDLVIVTISSQLWLLIHLYILSEKDFS